MKKMEIKNLEINKLMKNQKNNLKLLLREKKGSNY